jgi:hypothetical protein
MTTAVVLFATAGGIIPPSPSEQEIWDSFDPPEITDRCGDLWLYRERTVGMLRRYMRISVEVGRLPSLLGREFFRTRVTSYSASTFEDAVIFVHDVDRSLEKLDWFEKELIGKIVLQDYSQDQAAILLGCWRKTVARRFLEAVDQLSEIFLEGGLLTALPDRDLTYSETCQEGETEENSATDSE